MDNSTTLPKLFVTQGPLAGKTFDVPESGLRLGRSGSCEISIPDPALSRQNSMFEVREGSLWVTDLASANGTFVNGVQLGADRVLLKDGDLVVAGDSELRVGGEPPPPPPAPADVDLGLGGGAPAPDAPSTQAKTSSDGGRWL
ncbi:MAG: FHA domain-containing protein [Kiritimatiellae bacterium]|nr:FHA domain-containing protein [Kiritimatiellia bacterium]